MLNQNRGTFEFRALLSRFVIKIVNAILRRTDGTLLSWSLMRIVDNRKLFSLYKPLKFIPLQILA